MAVLRAMGHDLVFQVIDQTTLSIQKQHINPLKAKTKARHSRAIAAISSRSSSRSFVTLTSTEVKLPRATYCKSILLTLVTDGRIIRKWGYF